MIKDPKSNAFKPFDFAHLKTEIPELSKFNIRLSTRAFEHPIDSSNMTIATWQQLADIIAKEYHQYDGFVVLHGSDTMSYTASALSFMLQNLSKPIILTGSQLPIGTIRTDGKENLITAIEIAASKTKNRATVPEVAIYFEYTLLRGNRTTKFNAEHFNAFKSENYPALATAGIHIDYHHLHINSPSSEPFTYYRNMDDRVAVLKLFPGMRKEVAQAIIQIPELKGLIIETFGSGNAPMESWLIEPLENRINEGIMVVNVTQCAGGSVDQGRYETSTAFNKIGVISGYDMTTEAALTKLMHAIGMGWDAEKTQEYYCENLTGEISIK